MSTLFVARVLISSNYFKQRGNKQQIKNIKN